MSKDLTPKQWDIIHQQDPKLREYFNNVFFVDAKGNKIPLTSKEQKEQFEQFPKLNLIGNRFLNLCFDEGILISPIGNKAIRIIENILNGVNYGSEFKEFEEKVNLWYDGQLEPDYYMDNNDMALLEETKNIITTIEKYN